MDDFAYIEVIDNKGNARHRIDASKMPIHKFKHTLKTLNKNVNSIGLDAVSRQTNFKLEPINDTFINSFLGTK